MYRSTALALALLLAAPPSPSLAQPGDQCWTTPDDGTNLTYFNPQVTDNWRISIQSMDQQVMAQMLGVYQGDVRSPRGDQISHQWYRFSPDGIFDYQSQTCGSDPTLPCTPSQGTGAWTAHGQQDGSIYVMVNFTDQVRANQCFSMTVLPQQGGLQAVGGIFWQRVQ